MTTQQQTERDEDQVIDRCTDIFSRPFADGSGWRVAVTMPKPGFDYFVIGESDVSNMIQPDDMPALIKCLSRAWELYQDSKEPSMTHNENEFRSELEALINRHSAENGSNTPDFLLAEYLVQQLNTWDQYVTRREQWYGRAPRVVNDGGDQ